MEDHGWQSSKPKSRQRKSAAPGRSDQSARLVCSRPPANEANARTKSFLAPGCLIAAMLAFAMPCDAAEIVGIQGQCLDVQGGDTTDGTPIDIYHCHGAANQQWEFSNGQIVSSSGKCLDVQGGDPEDGARIVLFRCHAGPDQQWSIYNGQIVGMGGKCLDVQGGSAADRTPVILFHCHGARNQRWSMP
jgi:hypothetical protein